MNILLKLFYIVRLRHKNMGDDTIEELNNAEVNQYIGGVIFVSVLMLVGFLGNLHVLIVYTFYMKASSHRIFILVLGSLDFITCIVGMPFIIFELRNPLTFSIQFACKTLRFINYFICTASVLTLIVIATDRYRRICIPFGEQISEKVAKLLCCIVLLVALLLSWPAPVLYGIVHIETGNNRTLAKCWTEDIPNYDKYQGYFNNFLVLVVMITFITLIVLYTLIGRAISKHSAFKMKETELPPEKSNNNKKLSNLRNLEAESSVNQSSVNKLEVNSSSNHTTSQSNTQAPQHTKNDQRKNFHRARRTTLMFLLITIVFFFSYIPHLSLKIIVFMNKTFLSSLTFTGKVLYHTFVWCFFVNNVANCFVYGFFDVRFRRGVKSLYTKCVFFNKV